jgi:SAM-dependent methyltransferase
VTHTGGDDRVTHTGGDDRVTHTGGDEDLLGEHEWGSGTGPEFMGPRHEYRESLILRRLRSGVREGRVLNAGAGAGSLTVSLIERGYHVTSVDMSEPFLERLRELSGGRGEVRYADLTQLPFEDGSFDGIVCGEVLEHIPDDVAALAELQRVLRPGGVFVATVPANPWLYDWFDKWVGHLRRYSPEGMAGRLREAGFDDADVEGWGFPVTGLYYRLGYRPLVRRRVRALAPPVDQHARPSLRKRLAMRAFRAVLELDTLFIGRRPGYFGLLVTARARPEPPQRRTPAPPA